jgi:two-component system cell cycle response regulator CtrA
MTAEGAVETKALRSRIDTLEEENERLTQKLSVATIHEKEEAVVYPLSLRLTSQQGTILSVLIKREWASSGALHSILRTRAQDDGNLVGMQICKLRKKLRPLGVEIETMWGRGYRISPEHKRRLLQEIEAAQ